LDVIYLIYFIYGLQTLYNLNYTPATLGVQVLKEFKSGIGDEKG
jgi:hypothetical protein